MFTLRFIQRTRNQRFLDAQNGFQDQLRLQWSEPTLWRERTVAAVRAFDDVCRETQEEIAGSMVLELVPTTLGKDAQVETSVVGDEESFATSLRSVSRSCGMAVTAPKAEDAAGMGAKTGDFFIF